MEVSIYIPSGYNYWSLVHADDTALERLSRRDLPGDESDNNDESDDDYDFSDEPPDYPEFYNFLT